MAYELNPRSSKTVTKGTHYPLGATPTPDGVNFAVYSKQATNVFLLLFDTPDGEPTDIIELQDRDRFVWHAHVKGVKAGQLYGYKVRGEYRPEWGLRFNDAKLLLDPYAKAVTGKFRNTNGLLLAYDAQPGAGDRVLDRRDNTTAVPKAIVVDDAFDWQGVRSRSRPRAARHLRGAREGLHDREPRRARGPARHVCRPRLGRGDRAPEEPRGRRPRRPAGRRVARGNVAPRERPTGGRPSCSIASRPGSSGCSRSFVRQSSPRLWATRKIQARSFWIPVPFRKVR